MTLILNHDAASDITVRSWSGAETTFNTSHVPVDVLLTEGSESFVDELDVTFRQVTGADARHDAAISVALSNGTRFLGFESLNPDVATVDEDGYVTRVSDGQAKILVKTDRGTKRLNVPVSQDNSTVSEFYSFATGSLAEHIADWVDSRIAGLSPTQGKKLFTSMDHGNQIYVRNPNTWMKDCVTKTGISVWNSRIGVQYHGTLISPRDIIGCGHYGGNALEPGDIVRFVTEDNTVVNMTIAASTYYGTSKGGSGVNDSEVHTFTEDVPSSLKFVKSFPSDWQDYIPALKVDAHDSSYLGYRMPMFFSTRYKDARIYDCLATSNPEQAGSLVPPVDEQRLLYYEFVSGGDSGSPRGFIINDELVLHGLVSGLNDWTYPPLKTLINDAMTANGSPYQITNIDLSGFTNFA